MIEMIDYPRMVAIAWLFFMVGTMLGWNWVMGFSTEREESYAARTLEHSEGSIHPDGEVWRCPRCHSGSCIGHCD
jgi:hypothetical protein